MSRVAHLVVTVANVTLELPDVRGQILQRVQGEAEPGVIMARQTRLFFKQEFPLLMCFAGARHTRRHFDKYLRVSVDQTPDLREKNIQEERK